MTYGLFSSSSCTAASEVFHSTVGVTGGVAGSSAGVTTALDPGKYYWEAFYSGNALNAPSLSHCGSEVLTVSPAVTLSGSGTSSGSSVTITVTCASTPCTVTITITIDPPSHSVRAVAAKAKIVKIASGTFKIKKKGKDKLAVRLTSAGKKLLKKDHGHLKATILFSLKIHGHRVTQTGTIKIK